jgi:hypothetical protein
MPHSQVSNLAMYHEVLLRSRALLALLQKSFTHLRGIALSR